MKKFALILALTSLLSTFTYATEPAPAPVEAPNFILNGDFENHNGAKFSTVFTNWVGEQSITGTIALGPNDATPETVDNYVKTVKKGTPITTFTQELKGLPKGAYTLSLDSGGDVREAAYIELINASGEQIVKLDLLQNDSIEVMTNLAQTGINLEGDVTVRIYIAGYDTGDKPGKTVMFDNVKLISEDGYVPEISYVANAVKGTAVIDGIKGDEWKFSEVMPVVNLRKGAFDKEQKVTYQTMYDEENLYVLVNVDTDSVLNATGEKVWSRDCVEIFIDQNNEKTQEYQDDDQQFIIDYQGDVYMKKSNYEAEYVPMVHEKGFLIEAKIPLTLEQKSGSSLGFDVQIGLTDNQSERACIIGWSGPQDMSNKTPSVFGTLNLN